MEKAADVFGRFRKDPETIRTAVLAKHGPLLESAKKEIFDVESTTGLWSWKHFRCGWTSELGRPEVSRSDRPAFARELIEALALDLGKAGVDAKQRQEHAAALLHGAKEYGIRGEISEVAAKAIYSELHARVGTAWPRYAEAKELAKKRGWKDEALEMDRKQREFDSGLVYLGSVTDPGFERRRSKLAGMDD